MRRKKYSNQRPKRESFTDWGCSNTSDKNHPAPGAYACERRQSPLLAQALEPMSGRTFSPIRTSPTKIRFFHLTTVFELMCSVRPALSHPLDSFGWLNAPPLLCGCFGGESVPQLFPIDGCYKPYHSTLESDNWRIMGLLPLQFPRSFSMIYKPLALR